MLKSLLGRDRKVQPVQPVQPEQGLYINPELDPELVQGFLIPWVIDFQEPDGSRSYAVHKYRTELRNTGVEAKKIDQACTVAANLIYQAFRVEE